MMKACNIQWDFDGDEEAKESVVLPDEIDIPKEIEDDVDAISDYLTDTTGWCHKGFSITK